MTLDMAFFVFSMFACIAILYILAMLWFSNIRSTHLKSFLWFGCMTGVWIFFSAISSIAAPQHFTFLYTVHAVTGCVFPYVFFWYALQYSNAKIVRSKPFVFILCTLPLLDAIAFATNPLHHLMFLSYTYPDLPVGPLFWVHAIFGYVAFLGALVVIIVHVFRNARKTSIMLLTAFSTLFPFIINLLLAFNLLGTRYDYTSIGFFVTFTLFFLITYRTGPFNFKSIALSNIFTSLSDVIMIANARGVIVDSNAAFHKVFPTFLLNAGKTTVAEFVEWLSSRVSSCSTGALLSELGNIGKAHESGEFSLPLEDDAGLPDNALEKSGHRTFTLRRELIRRDPQKISGYMITMSDESIYRAIDRKSTRLNSSH